MEYWSFTFGVNVNFENLLHQLIAPTYDVCQIREMSLKHIEKQVNAKLEEMKE